MAPLEPWEKVLVDGEKFLQSVHGENKTCIDCHGGMQSPDKATAHTNLNPDPSTGENSVCSACHAEVSSVFSSSLHATQEGYWTVLDARSAPESHAQLETMFGNHCASCHTTCGSCHISQPKNVGGGLFSGHVFEKSPPMTRSCTACHGSRVGNEFLGKNEGFPGDVHFREARMSCIKCHEAVELHGAVDDAAESSESPHRYAGEEMPACINCHPEAGPGQTDNMMHNAHGDRLSCQVCHSITYTSCDGCHVAVSETSGNPFFETEATYPTFFIGRNPRQSETRPYDYVLVRHVPVSPDSFAFYGENLLSNFDALPTWAYTTPHNIQLKTPQNASCEGCHANVEIFLTADKVKESELAANAGVIVEFMPPTMDQIFNAPTMTPRLHEGATQCRLCHDRGVADAPPNPPDHAGREDWGCLTCHKVVK